MSGRRGFLAGAAAMPGAGVLPIAAPADTTAPEADAIKAVTAGLCRDILAGGRTA